MNIYSDHPGHQISLEGIMIWQCAVDISGGSRDIFGSAVPMSRSWIDFIITFSGAHISQQTWGWAPPWL